MKSSHSILLLPIQNLKRDRGRLDSFVKPIFKKLFCNFHFRVRNCIEILHQFFRETDV